MKVILSFSLLLPVLLSGACQQRTSNQNAGSGQSLPVFAKPDDAAQQALRDIAVILRANPSLKLGLDSSTVRQAQPGKPVRQALLDFNRLLRSNQIMALDSLVQAERSLLVPIQLNGRILTTIDLSHQKNGWSIASLGNQKAAADLNLLQALAGAGAEITVLEVPNLNATIYSVRKADGTNQYHTDYGGLSLREPIPMERLYTRLRQDALTFQRTYGKQLQKQRLVR